MKTYEITSTYITVTELFYFFLFVFYISYLRAPTWRSPSDPRKTHTFLQEYINEHRQCQCHDFNVVMETPCASRCLCSSPMLRYKYNTNATCVNYSCTCKHICCRVLKLYTSIPCCPSLPSPNVALAEHASTQPRARSANWNIQRRARAGIPRKPIKRVHSKK